MLYVSCLSNAFLLVYFFFTFSAAHPQLLALLKSAFLTLLSKNEFSEHVFR